MHWQSSAIIRDQYGVITRRQLLANGESRRVISRLLQSGDWVVLAPGIYFTQSSPPQDRALALAAQIAAGEGSVISGAMALRLQGVRCDAAARVTVLVPHDRAAPKANELINPKRCVTMPDHLSDGLLRVVSVARAAIDHCIGVRTLDDARARLVGPVQQRSCTSKQLLAAAREAGRVSPLVRAALDEIADGVHSVAEARARNQLVKAGFPAGRWNLSMCAPEDKFYFSPDCFWEEARLVLEIQSKEFHWRDSEWQSTMRRVNRLSGLGLLVVQVAPSRLSRDPHGWIEELRTAYEAGLKLPAPRVVVLKRA